MPTRFLLVVALLFLSVSPAFAHKLYVEAKLGTDTVRFEAYYEDDTPAQQARITVSKDDAVVAEGRTDEKGVWTCSLAPGSYRVRAETLGHAADATLEVPDKPVDISAPPGPDDHAANTHTPWSRVILGLGIIAGVTILGYVLTRTAKCKRDCGTD